MLTQLYYGVNLMISLVVHLEMKAAFLIIILNIALANLYPQDIINSLNVAIKESVGNACGLVNDEIDQTLDSLMHYASHKELKKVLSYYHQSESFVYINNGQPITHSQLADVYRAFFNQLDFTFGYKGLSSIVILNPIQIHCIWHGHQGVKLFNKEMVEVNWTSSLLFEKQDGRWVIIQAHTSNY